MDFSFYYSNPTLKLHHNFKSLIPLLKINSTINIGTFQVFFILDLNKILVPIDGSKKSFVALDRALTLAGFTHDQVTGIYVIPHVIDGGPRTKVFDKQLQEDAKIILKKSRKTCRKQKCQIY